MRVFRTVGTNHTYIGMSEGCGHSLIKRLVEGRGRKETLLQVTDIHCVPGVYILRQHGKGHGASMALGRIKRKRAVYIYAGYQVISAYAGQE